MTVMKPWLIRAPEQPRPHYLQAGAAALEIVRAWLIRARDQPRLHYMERKRPWLVMDVILTSFRYELGL